MKHYYPPLFSSKRDWRVTELVRRGSATEDELIEAQFGGAVSGLHKDTPQTQVIEFKDFWSDPDLNWLSFLYRQGYIRGQRLQPASTAVEQDYATPDDQQAATQPAAASPTTIYINRPLMSPGVSFLGLLTGRAVFARAHDVAEAFLEPFIGVRFALGLAAASASTSFRYAMLSSLVKGVRPSIADVVCEEQAHGWMLRDPDSWIMKDAFRNAADNHISINMSSGRQVYVRFMQLFDMALAMMPRKGYKSDSEKSPRLYNIIARNYPAWGKIAEDKEELVAMLMDAGVRMPHFGKWYKPSRYIDANLLNPKGYVNAPTAELNVGLNATRSQEILGMMWEQCLPLLYADMLVRMGDSQGYQRMGYDPNQRDVYGIPQPLRPQQALLTSGQPEHEPRG